MVLLTPRTAKRHCAAGQNLSWSVGGTFGEGTNGRLYIGFQEKAKQKRYANRFPAKVNLFAHRGQQGEDKTTLFVRRECIDACKRVGMSAQKQRRR